ncbi:MAG: peptide chain release factor N(5)-glutamine methyltransferase, partial [Solirubrobacterales bacterium]|nr:peptide chain release factor N(5)-glutamine methyltransferase [Solirubrobacterales bacterium]
RVTRAELFTRSGPVSGGAFEELLARRAAREPVAYILGRRAFRRLSLAVDPRVLIPRPETELLVEVGLGLDRAARVADLGTGSGAVALALKDERPDLELTGIDVSADALTVARANAERLGLEARFLCGDLLVGGPYDAVLANLPYVAQGDPLPPEVSLYEPREALFAGPEGLDVIRRLVGRLDGVRVVALEVGAGQAPAVAALLGDRYTRLQVLRDLAGHERVMVARR